MVRIALLFVLLTIGPAAAQSDTAVLTGTVQDASGASIEGVIALLFSNSVPVLRYIARTDAAGVYRFVVPSPGSYTLELRAQGFFLTKLKSIKLSGREKAMQPALLRPPPNAGCGNDVYPSDIRLLPSGRHVGTLAGRVRLYRPANLDTKNGGRSLFRDMQIHLSDGQDNLLGRINVKYNEGFQFTDLPPGNYKVQLKGIGLHDESWYVTVLDDLAVEYDFPADPCGWKL